MKQVYTLIFTITTALTFAQIPSGYYDSATGSGYTLKTNLKEIINTIDDGLATEFFHQNQGYNSLYTGYVSTDSDNYYEFDGSVLDMYSEKPLASDSYNYTHGNMQCGSYNSEADCYNREHIFPQGFYNENEPMRSDIHHVVPSDGYVNNGRGNLPFGVVSSVTNSYSNGSRWGSGSNYGYNGNVFEPIDEFKGDIARMLLYFAVRYEDEWNDAGWDSHTTTNNPLNGTSDQFYEDWYIDLLLDWHQNDPVSQREIDRNNAAFTYQGNRNPFIDNPNYADMIWNPSPDTENPTDPTSLVASNPTDNSVDIAWNASTDNIGVVGYDIYIGGTYSATTANTSYTVTGLTADTNYCFTVKANDAAGNESGFSNQDCEMTTDNGSSGGSDELFFSEYIEGSGNNKVLEIANFSGATVNLSTYTMKLSSNGNANWTVTYSFPGGTQILNGDVYVIAQGSSTLCNSEEDDENNAITAFNGNDAIGLFKNDVLIDIFGTLGDDTDYAKDVTLVRKSTFVGPNTVYTPSEWNTFPQNNCDDLGEHTITLSVSDVSDLNYKMYPNPVSTNKLNFAVNKAVSVKVFDILGKTIISKQITPNENWLNITNLNKGIYLIKMNVDNRTVVKKLIRN